MTRNSIHEIVQGISTIRIGSVGNSNNLSTEADQAHHEYEHRESEAEKNRQKDALTDSHSDRAYLASGSVGRSMVTPVGFETVSSIAKHDEVSRFPTENPKGPPTSRGLARADSSKVAKLALLASNAVRNLDLHRAEELLGELLQITGTPAFAAPSVRASKRQSEGAYKQSESHAADFRWSSGPAMANHRPPGVGKGRAV